MGTFPLSSSILIKLPRNKIVQFVCFDNYFLLLLLPCKQMTHPPGATWKGPVSPTHADVLGLWRRSGLFSAAPCVRVYSGRCWSAGEEGALEWSNKKSLWPIKNQDGIWTLCPQSSNQSSSLPVIPRGRAVLGCCGTAPCQADTWWGIISLNVFSSLRITVLFSFIALASLTLKFACCFFLLQRFCIRHRSDPFGLYVRLQKHRQNFTIYCRL